jgi:hypothetical protein
MVKSVLDAALNYPETKNIDLEDKNFAAQEYEITLFSMPTNIVLGQPKYTFVDKDIVYYPIYLVVEDKVVMQIGLYEILSPDIPKIIDEDGDIDLDLLKEPLLYAFTTPALIKNPFAATTASMQNRPQAELPNRPQAELQNEETALKERQDFKKNSKPLWIQKFMENSNYKIVENEGKGDCLFAVIRDGLKGKREITVDEIRQMLAKEVDEALYMNYLTLFLDAQEQDKVYTEELKGLVQRNKGMKERLAKEKDRNKQMAIITQADEIKQRHKQLTDERKMTRALLTEEVAFMKGVKNVTDLKAKVQTCEFWGNTWAISTLERLLHIKLILLSEENYNSDDIDNVLQCGQLNDDKLGDTFEPLHYILTCYQGWHYQLITYKNKGALTFNEIPYDIKMLVASKCLERLAGPYYIIPAFRDFLDALPDEKIKRKVLAEKEKEEEYIPSSNTIAALTTLPLYAFAGDSLEEMNKSLTEAIQPPSEFYETKTVLQFYTKSLDKPLPGHGVGEKVDAVEEKNGLYKELAKIKSWRRKLANEYEAPFKLDGHLWQTVEHYYQGSKFKKGYPDFYLQFSLDSGSDISKDVGLAQAANKKGVKSEKNMPKKQIDKDFFLPISSENEIKRSEKVLEEAMRAKFTQNPELNMLLKATKKAKLQQFTRGLPPIVFIELMRVRHSFL